MSSVTLDRRAPGAPREDDSGRGDWLRGAPTTRTDVLVALGLALVVLVVAWVWRSPIVPTDPYHYVHRALDFPDRVWIPLGYTRYGIIVPNIIPATLFGNAEATYYFWPFIAIGVLTAGVYLIGRRFWGPVAGVVAVVVLFTNTIVFYNMTRLYPDVLSMAAVVAALFCALMARDRGFRGRAGVLWLLACGFLVGWSFEIRETALFAWPIIVVALCRRGTVLRALGLAVLAALPWAALDVFVSAVAYGDPFLKVWTLLGFGGPATDPTEIAEIAARTRLDVLTAIPGHAIATRPDGWFMVIAGAVAILAVLVPNKPLRYLALSFTGVYVINLMAGGLIDPERIFGDLLNIRYWIQYVPWLALTIGGLVGWAASVLARRVDTVRARTAVAAGLAVLVCAYPVGVLATWVPTIQPFAANGGDALEDLRTHLVEAKVPDGTTVWTDLRTQRLLPIFERGFFGGERVWDGRIRRIADPAEMQSGDLVVIYSAHDNDTCFHCRILIDPWLEEHPGATDAWDLEYTAPAGNLELYRVR